MEVATQLSYWTTLPDKVENAHLVNPDYLSDDINDIYDEYEKMRECK